MTSDVFLFIIIWKSCSSESDAPACAFSGATDDSPVKRVFIIYLFLSIYDHFFGCRWFKLNSKCGRKEKERGGLQVTVQFTRNNMTASMFDLTIKDKPRSVFGKLKDRVTGRKRGDVESSSAILPGRYAALSGSLGQPSGEMDGGTLGQPDVEITEEKKSKMKEFLKGKLRKSSDSRSCASLASEGSVFSVASDHPPPSLDLLSDPPSSPVYTTKARADAHYGEADLAKKGEFRNKCRLSLMLPDDKAVFFPSFQQFSPASTPQRFLHTNGPSATRQAKSKRLSSQQIQPWSLSKATP